MPILPQEPLRVSPGQVRLHHQTSSEEVGVGGSAAKRGPADAEGASATDWRQVG
jgi:hypothetical protein